MKDVCKITLNIGRNYWNTLGNGIYKECPPLKLKIGSKVFDALSSLSLINFRVIKIFFIN